MAEDFEDRYTKRETQRDREDQVRDRSWLEYRQLIISELERLNKSIGELSNRLDRNYHEYGTEFSKIKVDIAMLQIKSGIWGGVAGALIAFGAVLIRFVSAGH